MHPKLLLKEKQIDEFIEQMKNNGYQTLEKATAVMFEYGSNFITNLISQIINKKIQFQTFTQTIEAMKNESETQIEIKNEPIINNQSHAATESPII